MKRNLKRIIDEAIESRGVEVGDYQIIPSASPEHGDFATNVSFQIAGSEKKSPFDVATEIAQDISSRDYDLLKKVEAVKPGFINFTLSDKAILDDLSQPLKKFDSDYGGKKVIIEFTDPNPFKELHIGHLYSNIVGQSIANLFESMGASVIRANYQGDVGLHVAKAIWGMERKMEAEGLDLENMKVWDLSKKAEFLGQAYALGAQGYEEDAVTKEEVIAINKKIYQQDPSVMGLYEAGRAWSLSYFETQYARLMNVKDGKAFDRYYFESEAGPRGLEIVKEHQDIFVQSEGATIFKGEDYGLHSRVFVNSLGLPTYEAKELGLAFTKMDEYKFDLSVMVTANEINEYFKVLIQAISLLDAGMASKMKHISHGMVKLPDGKMSSRTGNVVTAQWLLDEGVRRAKEKVEESKKELPNVSSDVSEMIGVGAIKWALLKSGIGKDIEFSFDESISFEGNSGPYLQYSVVRARSVLAKEKPGELNLEGITLSREERGLLVLLVRYSDVVVNAAHSFSPNLLSEYLFSLAQGFNLFYQKHKILQETGNTKQFRLALTERVGVVLAQGLGILGISVPEKM